MVLNVAGKLEAEEETEQLTVAIQKGGGDEKNEMVYTGRKNEYENRKIRSNKKRNN